jgi:hypothetical protein
MDGLQIQYIPARTTGGGGGTGTVTNIGTTAPITGGPITTTGNIGVTDFVASGASHARGTVPDPGAVAGTTKFLREDATWAVPAGGSAFSVYIDVDPPPGPSAAGDLWWNDEEGVLKIYYTDANSSQWVDASAAAAGTDGVGVPVGGATGQVLTKVSGTDFDTDWEDVPTGLPVGGTTGQVLTKLSGTDFDVAWEDPTGGGGGSGDLVEIARVVTTGSQTTVAFSSIPGTYHDLMISYRGRDTSSAVDEVGMRLMINGDTTAGNYTNSVHGYHSPAGTGGVGVAASAAGAAFLLSPGTLGNANAIAGGKGFIANYASTFGHKVVNGEDFYIANATLVNRQISFIWKSTAAITDLLFTAAQTAFQDGSTFTLYGLGGATPGASTPDWVSTHPLTRPTSGNARDEEWDDTTNMSGPVNGLAPAWTTFGAAQTRAYASTKLVLTGTAAGGVSPNATGMWKAAPTTPYTVTIPVTPGNDQNYNYMGVGLRSSVSGKFVLMGFYLDTNGLQDSGIQYLRYNSATSLASASSLRKLSTCPTLWVQITNDGTNIIARYSVSGVVGTFTQFLTELLTSHFSGGNLPDEFCLVLDPFSVNTPVGQFGPVRVS